MRSRHMKPLRKFCWPNLSCLWLSLWRPSQAVPKKGNRKKQQQGPHADAMAGPNHLTTSLHALKICPGVATSKWNERPAVQVSGLRGVLFMKHQEIKIALVHCIDVMINIMGASSLATWNQHFFPISTACSQKEKTCRQNTWSDVGEVVEKFPDSKASNLGETIWDNLGSQPWRLPSCKQAAVSHPWCGIFFSCKLTAEMTKLTVSPKVQQIHVLWFCEICHLQWAVWKLERLLKCPRNGRDVGWSLVGLTTSAKCHCSHSRLYIYNLSSEAVVRLPVKVLKTSQNRVLIISWRTIQYKLAILDWKRQHERFKHDFARLKTKKNHNCMMCLVKASSMFSSPCKSEWLPFGSCALALKVLRPFQRSTLGFNSSHRYLRRHHPQIFAGFKFEIGPRANESTKLLVPTHQKHEWIDVSMTKSLSHHRKLRCRCSWRPLPKFNTFGLENSTWICSIQG